MDENEDEVFGRNILGVSRGRYSFTKDYKLSISIDNLVGRIII